ncbi:hypothetical protein ACE1B6_20220 [Aerosakkonemataceae cyanobacterium BLCC-F154]|uniref:CopG family transcriptional regulator n=1 Tax=Floridaenema fluviatile BLCC-F154 TaxID=3153640 RepID=A0ABV4YFH9_9CYAN
MTKVTIEIPEQLISQLEGTGYPLQDIVLKALERYVESEDSTFNITKTRTWELCGTFQVVEPEAEYIVGQDEQGKIITNYGENVDDILYGLSL